MVEISKETIKKGAKKAITGIDGQFEKIAGKKFKDKKERQKIMIGAFVGIVLIIVLLLIFLIPTRMMRANDFIISVRPAVEDARGAAIPQEGEVFRIVGTISSVRGSQVILHGWDRYEEREVNMVFDVGAGYKRIIRELEIVAEDHFREHGPGIPFRILIQGELDYYSFDEHDRFAYSFYFIDAEIIRKGL